MAQRNRRRNQVVQQEALEARQLLSGTVFTVTSAANGGAGSLRHAILEANAAGGAATIDFGLSGSGVRTIALTAALPAITQSGVTLDATSQPGYSGSPLIQLSGHGIAANNAIGLTVHANDVSIKGLIVNGFSRAGIKLGIIGSASVVSGDTVSACWIGTDSTGAAAGPSQGQGIIISSGNDLIGGAVGDENVISGNAQNGLELLGGAGALITNNDIGVDPSGNIAVPNQADGIFITGTVSATVGGSGALGNVISGNSKNGIAIRSSITVDVYGNKIGTNAAGTAALGNGFNGIRMAGGTITIGETGAGNVISGNGESGVAADQAPHVDPNNPEIESFQSQSIVNNKIGTNAAGDAAIGNAASGITVVDGSEEIGGNVLSGNSADGVYLIGGSAYFYGDDLIGLNAAGTAALGNAGAGIKQVGGFSQIMASVISGNGANGINIVAGTSMIDNCQIGTDASGTLHLGNGASGIRVTPGDLILTGPTIAFPGSVPAGQIYDAGPAVQIGNAQIGAAAPDASANVIAFNGRDGIMLGKSATAVMRGNSIFANAGLAIDYVRGTPSASVVPTIQSVTTSSAGTTITFSVPYTLDEDNYVDFYVSPTGSSGQGKTYLGSMDVKTTNNVVPGITPIGGQQNVFTFTITQPLTPGEVITATNTRGVQAIANGVSYQFTTSPFSSAFTITTNN